MFASETAISGKPFRQVPLTISIKGAELLQCILLLLYCYYIKMAKNDKTDTFENIHRIAETAMFRHLEWQDFHTLTVQGGYERV